MSEKQVAKYEWLLGYDVDYSAPSSWQPLFLVLYLLGLASFFFLLSNGIVKKKKRREGIHKIVDVKHE